MRKIDTEAKPDKLEVKAWGVTWPVFEGDTYSRYALECRAGGYSSLHYHEQRANRFTIERGTILIWQAFGPCVTSHTITDGGQFSVPSLVVHGFAVLEDAEVVEEYWPDRGGRVERSDIIRLCHGGTADPESLPGLATELLRRIA